MEWLSQLSGGALVGGGATLTIVTAAVFYVVKFQTTFTDRLETQGKKDEQTISELGIKLDRERALRRRAEDRSSSLVFILNSNGIEIPRHLREEPHDAR